MSEEIKHTEPDFNDEVSGFFDKVDIPYEKSKDEVWNQLAERMEKQPVQSGKIMLNTRMVMALAAVALVSFSVFSVMRFYTETVRAPRGQHLVATLPDGSTVNLNADSKISFHPFWWRFSRTVKFAGEGFFKVQKGKKFEVVSNVGTTVVVGTSFNIYNRGNAYKVTCVTGKVKVISTTSEEVILSPEYHAEVDENGNIVVYKKYPVGQATSWVNNMFIFTSAPLAEVLKEIELQYNIHIIFRPPGDYFYTGFFSRDKQPEEVLDLLAKTFGFTFVKRSDNEYEIIQTATSD